MSPPRRRQMVGLHVPNCELFAGMSGYKEYGLVAASARAFFQE